jgi:hypothetical protein
MSGACSTSGTDKKCILCFVRSPERTKIFWKSTRKLEESNEMGLNNHIIEGCPMILLVEISQYWWNSVKTVMKFLAPEETIYRVAKRLSYCREEICYVQFLNYVH